MEKSYISEIQDLKVIMLGDENVGKTSIFNQIKGENFEGNRQSTLKPDYMNYLTEVYTGKQQKEELSLQIWDTVGQEKYNSMTTNYYKKAIGVFLVYSIDDEKSFHGVEYWWKKLNENQKQNTIQVIMLVGNKSDLIMNRQVSFKEGQRYAKYRNMLSMETTTKDRSSIENMVQKFSQELYEQNKGSLNTFIESGIECWPGEFECSNISLVQNNQFSYGKKKKCC